MSTRTVLPTTNRAASASISASAATTRSPTPSSASSRCRQVPLSCTWATLRISRMSLTRRSTAGASSPALGCTISTQGKGFWSSASSAPEKPRSFANSSKPCCGLFTVTVATSERSPSCFASSRAWDSAWSACRNTLTAWSRPSTWPSCCTLPSSR